MHDRATRAAERVGREGNKNGEAPTGKRTEKRSSRGMDGRNETGVTNEI